MNPIVNPRLSASGQLTFENAAVSTGAGPAPSGYQSEWHQFDNATGETRPIGRARGNGPLLEPPGALPAQVGEMVQIDVWSEASGPAAQPVRLHFRRAASGWTLIGLDRNAVQAASVTTPAGRSPQ